MYVDTQIFKVSSKSTTTDPLTIFYFIVSPRAKMITKSIFANKLSVIKLPVQKIQCRSWRSFSSRKSILYLFLLFILRVYQILVIVRIRLQKMQKFLFLKVVSAKFLLVCFLSLSESTCQTRRKIFYFTSKVLLVLEKIKF